MSAHRIEHRGIVQRIEGGKAIVAMETTRCSTCGQGEHCAVAKLASGRAATLLSLPATAKLKAGDVVCLALPQSRLTPSALIGYLFPAFAMLLGAVLGALLQGSDAATALGGIGGFLGALAVVRLVIDLLPGLLPAPQLILLSNQANASQQEFHHER